MEFRGRRARGQCLLVSLAVLACVAACGSVPNIAPPPPQTELLGAPERITSAAELIAAIDEHLGKVRTARVESINKSGSDESLPAVRGLGVVRFRPAYASDTIYESPTTPDPKARRIDLSDARYDTVVGDTSTRPWKSTKRAADSMELGSWLIPSKLGKIDEVIEGERILGQPVIGYRFISEGFRDDGDVGHDTFYMNAKKQLVRFRTRLNGVFDRTETFYDFGVSIEIGPPPADQVKPS